MGANYYVACRDCNVKRDLDELWPQEPHSRKEALAYSKEVSPFQAGLLIGFLKEHQYHNCILFPVDPAMYCKEDYDFWGKE